MDEKLVFEHHRRLKFTTLAVAGMIAAVVLVALVGIVVAACMMLAHKIGVWEGAVILGLGISISVAFGLVLLAVTRRMFAVKTVRLLEGKRMEVLTRRGLALEVRLPDDVEHVVASKDGLTIGIRKGQHRYVIDSAEFANGERLRDHLAMCLKE